MNPKLPYEKLIAEKLQHLQLPDKNTLWQKMKTELDAALPVAPKRKRGVNVWWKISVVCIALLGGTWGIINYWGTEENNKEEKVTAAATTLNETASSATDHPTEHTPLPLSGSNQNNTVGKRPRGHLEETGVGANIGPLPQESFSAPDMNDQQQLSQSAPNPSKEGPVLTPYNVENSKDPGVVAVSPVSAQYQKLHVNKANLSDRNDLPGAGGGALGKLTVPAYASALPDVAAKRKLLLREMKKQERKEERELAKSYRTYHSFWGESTDRWFAAGIAPYQNIAVAGQQSYAYNSAAGKSIVTDYIPSPYLQLHLTNRVYLLSEFQFNSPQATPSLLLSQKTVIAPFSSAAYTENVYLRKLYYFNMPVSFYYSPMKNFYVGSGLQFSSYNSGLADLEQRSSSNTLLHSEVLKLKDDSLSGMIRGSEWRYLFDANYYYNRFMFGVRYNQALSPFVNLHINNALPPTQARNQAFQLYLRYNLVVSGRK